MGDISSKSCIDALQGSNLIKSAEASSKNHIVLVNPEIHLHSNNGNGMSGSLNNEKRIKELKEELMTKQDEIDKLREIHQLEDHERNAENIRINELLSEKENKIQDQDDLLRWHYDIVKDKLACLDEVYLYGQTEKRIRMEHRARGDGFPQQANKKRNQKKNKLPRHVSRSLSNSHPNRNAHKYYSQRTRSKTEINFQHDPMELWQWNGTKWILIEKNGSAHNEKQNDDPKSSRISGEPQQKQNSVETMVPSSNKICGARSNDKLQTDVPLTSKMCDNGKLVAGIQLPHEVCEGSTEEESKEFIYCLDDTVAKEMDSHQHVAATIATDITISFDEQEISRFMNHDVTLFGMPKRIKQPE